MTDPHPRPTGPASRANDPSSTAPGGATPTPDPPTTTDHAGHAIGTVVGGRYRLLDVLGEGGMGTVYRAEQTEPVRRVVAVKLISPGAGSAQVLARFEAERQALALMDHPHIARVLDAGAAPDGRPFVVMELVKGPFLTRYCDDKRLTVRQRLDLFTQVCSAVQHAHQKGVIHRDLKPSNVLVAEVDGKPVPKVIDFGVAKAVGRSLTDLSLVTGVGAVVGTPAYMAPEQADPTAVDIDTRADVYALGVVLYELLTGHLPLDRNRFKDAGLLDFLRAIREEEPPTPSTRLGTSAELPAVAAARGADPRRLADEVKGDLDWIVMKCLEKDRNRRYETANGLAADVRRYLADEPVAAGPPSAGYKLRKFLKRNRGPVVAAALLAAALVAGITGTTVGLVRALTAEESARREATAKDEALDAVKIERDEKDRQRAAAEQSAVVKNAVADYLVQAFRKPDPGVESKDLRVLDLLDQSAADLDTDPALDPPTRTALRFALGRTYAGLSVYHKAIPLLERARAETEARLGASHRETITVGVELAQTYGRADRPADAVRLARDLLDRSAAAFGPADRTTLEAMLVLHQAYMADGREADAVALGERMTQAAEASLGADDRLTLTTQNDLATQYEDRGDYGRAVRLLEQVHRAYLRKAGPDDDGTLTAQNNLGLAYYKNNQADKAIPLLEDCHRRRVVKLGETHDHTLGTLSNLASSYQYDGQFDRAAAMQAEVLKLTEGKLGPDHYSTLKRLNNLGDALNEAGRPKEAIGPLKECVRRYESRPTRNVRMLLGARRNLATAYRLSGNLLEALAEFDRTWKTAVAEFGEADDTSLTSANDLAVATVQAGRPEEAARLMARVVELRKAHFPADHPETTTALNNFGWILMQAGRPADGIPPLEECLRLRTIKPGPDHELTLTTTLNLALCYHRVGRRVEAFDRIDTARRASLARYGAGHSRTVGLSRDLLTLYLQDDEYDRAEPLLAEQLERDRKGPPAAAAGTAALLGKVRLSLGKYADAESVLRDCLAIREKAQPTAWSTANARSMLGDALLGQGKTDAAGPQLHGGFDGLKAASETIPAVVRNDRLREAADRVARLYLTIGYPEEAAKWWAEAARYPELAPLPRPGR